MSVAMYLGGAVLAACALLYAYMKYALTYWQRRKVPVVPPTAPFGNYGATVLGKRSFGEVSSDMYFQHRDERFIGTYFASTPLLQLHDPEIIRQVFIKEFQDFNGRGMFSDPDNDPLSGHLFILSGQPWRNMRVKLSPTFTTGKIKYMFNTISECADYLREHISSSMKNGGGKYEEDARELLARFSTDVISSVAFGIESNSMKNPNSEFRKMSNKAISPSIDQGLRTLLVFFASPIMKALRIRSVPSDVHSFFTRIVDEMVAHREGNGVERADMLHLLIKLKNEGFVPPDAHGVDNKTDDAAHAANGANGVASPDGRQKLTQSQIAAQVFVFFIAGFETTSTTTSFTLYELSKNPDIQEKVIEEIDAVLKKHGGKITYETLMDLPYMDMAIQETMRLYPPVPFLTREAMVKRQLPQTDVVLEKGTRLLIPVRALHIDPQYWQDPQRYNPLRFTEEAKKSRPSMVYMPFGDGPRICIGMRLGLVQVKMALVTILTQCKVSLAPGMPHDPRISPRSIVPHLIDGCRLILTAR